MEHTNAANTLCHDEICKAQIVLTDRVDVRQLFLQLMKTTFHDINNPENL